jgi:hypothetical protein
MSHHHSGNDFCGFEMALLIFYGTEHVNANTTMNLMYKTFVVKPREKPQFTYVEFTFFFYMNVCCTLSQPNFPDVSTFTYQI